MYQVCCERCGAVLVAAPSVEEASKPMNALCSSCINGTGKPFSIAEATISEYPQMVALGFEVFNRWSDSLVFEPPNTNGRNRFVFLNRRQHVCGYVRFRSYPESIAIEEIAVAYEWRRRGIGKQLVGQVLNCAQRLNRQHVCVFTSRKNPLATKFFRSLGFSVLHVDRMKDAFGLVAPVAQTVKP